MTDNEVTIMHRKIIGKEQVCEICGVHRSTVDRWRDPVSPSYQPDFPVGKRYEKSFVLFWYEDDIIKWRDDHLTPA
jgi:hypothetical protein